jgi:hypothetical protein
MDSFAGSSSRQAEAMDQPTREASERIVGARRIAMREQIFSDATIRLLQLMYQQTAERQQLDRKHMNESDNAYATIKEQLLKVDQYVRDDMYNFGLWPQPNEMNSEAQRTNRQQGGTTTTGMWPPTNSPTPWPGSTHGASHRAFGTAIPPAGNAQSAGPFSALGSHPSMPIGLSSPIPMRQFLATGNAHPNGPRSDSHSRAAVSSPAAEASPLAASGRDPASSTAQPKQGKVKKRTEILLRTKKDAPKLAPKKDRTKVPSTDKSQTAPEGASMRSGMAQDHQTAPDGTTTFSSMAQDTHPAMQGPSMFPSMAQINRPAIQGPSMFSSMAQNIHPAFQGFGMLSNLAPCHQTVPQGTGNLFNMDPTSQILAHGTGMSSSKAQTGQTVPPGTGMSSKVAQNTHPATQGTDRSSSMAQTGQSGTKGTGAKARSKRRKLPSSPLLASEMPTTRPFLRSGGDSQDSDSEAHEVISLSSTMTQKNNPAIQGTDRSSIMAQTGETVTKGTGVKAGSKRRRLPSSPLEASEKPPTTRPFVRSGHDSQDSDGEPRMSSAAPGAEKAPKDVFMTKMISYTPAPESNELDLTWTDETHLQLKFEKQTFEPYNGVQSRVWIRHDMVLDHKWNGKVFYDMESARFEIYRKDGARLRILFPDKSVIHKFIFYFRALFEDRVASIEERYVTAFAPLVALLLYRYANFPIYSSAILGTLEDFSVPSAKSHPSMLQ